MRPNWRDSCTPDCALAPSRGRVCRHQRMPPARTKLIANGMQTAQHKTSLRLRLKRHAQARECLFGAVHVFLRPADDVLLRLSGPQGPLHLHKSLQQRSARRKLDACGNAPACQSCITSATSSTGYSLRTCSIGSIFLPRHLVAREKPALKVARAQPPLWCLRKPTWRSARSARSRAHTHMQQQEDISQEDISLR